MTSKNKQPVRPVRVLTPAALTGVTGGSLNYSKIMF
jgi:hypothetical protein